MAAGLGLLAVPTAFSIFPGWTEWPTVVLALILVGWVLVAGVAVRAQTVRERAIDDLAEATERQRGVIRLATTREVLRTLLCDGTMGMPSGYEFVVYLAEADGRLLTPIFPTLPLRPGEHDVRSFAEGKGATGSAWLRRSTFVVTGDKVHNNHYELDADQQALYADYRTVASTPIDTLGSRPFGVLTTLAKFDDGHFDDGGAGHATLAHLAAMVGVVLKSIPTPADLALLVPGGTVTPSS